MKIQITNNKNCIFNGFYFDYGMVSIFKYTITDQWLTYSDICGNWSVRTYNDAGKQVLYRNSSGYWSKYIYNSDGKMVYIIDSDGCKNTF